MLGFDPLDRGTGVNAGGHILAAGHMPFIGSRPGSFGSSGSAATAYPLEEEVNPASSFNMFNLLKYDNLMEGIQAERRRSKFESILGGSPIYGQSGMGGPPAFEFLGGEQQGWGVNPRMGFGGTQAMARQYYGDKVNLGRKLIAGGFLAEGKKFMDEGMAGQIRMWEADQAQQRWEYERARQEWEYNNLSLAQRISAGQADRRYKFDVGKYRQDFKQTRTTQEFGELRDFERRVAPIEDAFQKHSVVERSVLEAGGDPGQMDATQQGNLFTLMRRAVTNEMVNVGDVAFQREGENLRQTLELYAARVKEGRVFGEEMVRQIYDQYNAFIEAAAGQYNRIKEATNYRLGRGGYQPIGEDYPTMMPSQFRGPTRGGVSPPPPGYELVP